MAPRRGWKKKQVPCDFDIASISMPGEEWRPVVGWERFYRISNLGRCLSLHQTGRLITGLKLRGGYRALKLRDGDRKAYGILHCMVLEAFVGPRPDGQYACHGNGDPTDNRLANLRWDTNAANQADRKIHGTTRYRGPHALTEDDVRTIRMSRSDNAWHGGINAYADAEHKAGREFSSYRWLYNAKHAMHETYRGMYLFASERIKDTDLRCALGKKCRACPILKAIEESMQQSKTRAPFPSAVDDEDIDAAKVATCIAHVLQEKTEIVDGAFWYRKDDRHDF